MKEKPPESDITGRGLRSRLFEATAIGKMSPVGAAVAYVILIVWSALVIFPTYWLAIAAFKGPGAVEPTYIPFVDFQPTLDVWRGLFNYYPNCDAYSIARELPVTIHNAVAYILSPLANIAPLEARPCQISQTITNSLFTSLSATALSLITGSMAAYALTRIHYKLRIGNIIMFLLLCFGMVMVTGYVGVPWYVSSAIALALFFLLVRTLSRRFTATAGNNAIMFWMIAQRILPPIVVAIPSYMFFQSVGLLDTTTALIFVYATMNLPIVVWLMHDFITALPVELEEAAMLEGASSFRIFWEIVLPLTRSGLAATALLCFILNWNEYILAVFLTTSKAITLPVFAEMWGETTVVLLMVAPTAIMAVFLQRYIDRGVLLGAVKG